MILQEQAQSAVITNYEQRAKTMATTINYNMANALENYLIVHEMLSIFGSVNHYTRFAPFAENLFGITDGSTELPSYISFIINIDIVNHQDLPSYSSNVRSWGGSYQNFSGVYSFGSRTLDVIREKYYIQSQTIPSSVISVGTNYGSFSYLNTTISTAIRTNCATTTMKLNFPNATGGGIGVMVFKPIYQQDEPVGVLAAGIETSQLLKASTTLRDGEGVAIFDASKALLGATTSSSGVNIIHSSGTEVQNLISRAAIRNSNYNCSFMNNTWQVVFFSSTSSSTNMTKLIPLVLCILFMIAAEIVLVFVYGYRRIILAKRAQDKARNRVEVLEVHRAKLGELLKKSVKSEEKARSIINSIPDLVISITKGGKIIQSNNSFDSNFTYSEKEWLDGININTILAELDDGFFLAQQHNTVVDTCAYLRNGEKISVEVKVAAMSANSCSVAAVNDDNQSPRDSFDDTDDEAYLILIRRK
ncbi:hypothetical protein AKO1_014387 [Acrasis kona]|uniref:PAS domain-containing protein n=1 Tax=Acrasis kona TaxID=1008807 RepID=A0AAW2Z151_9EUKA